MKRLIVLIVGLFFMPILFAISDPPCELDYPDEPCIEVSVTNDWYQIYCMDGTTMIWVQFEYCYRYFIEWVNGEQKVFRDVIIYNYKCATPQMCEACNVELAILQHIYQTKSNELHISGQSGSLEDTCYTNFNVFVEQCWQHNIGYDPVIGQYSSASPCPTEDSICCRHTYEVCFRATCTHDSSQVRVSSIEAVNSYDPMEDCTEPCISNCDYWAFDWLLPVEKKVEYDINIDEYYDKNYSVMPNPTDGNLRIILPDFGTDNIVLRVTDLNGRILFSDQLINSQENNINLSKLSNGTYIYQILVDQTKKYNGLFIIEK